MRPALNLFAVSILIAAGLPWLAVGFALGYLVFEVYDG